MDNTLYYGDNLDILRHHIASETVDLVYLDPPFNSNATYNVLFGDTKGHRSAAQIQAFDDTWHWDTSAAEAFDDVLGHGGRPAEAMRAFETLLGHGDMLAYLSMMAPRLIELRRVLKPTGSIYLHCDPTASHYLKVLMDAVFGAAMFRNEVVWKRTTAHSSAKKYAPVHDVLLYFGRDTAPTWNAPRTDYNQEYLDKYYRFDDGDGRLYWRADITGAGIRHGDTGKPWRGLDVSAKGRHWAYPPSVLEQMDKDGRIYWPPGGTGWPQEKRFREDLKGRAVSDLWDDIDRINPVGSERLGYPTQKPLALLERIIGASSNPDDLVLDPFCGCGTAVVAAQKLGRRWIGIDITHLAVNLMRTRLRDTFGDAAQFKVVGEPVSVDDAEELARTDPYQFQFWALGLVGARPHEEKKGADKGIDGRLYFRDDPKAPAKQVIISVKAGNLHRNMVHELRGVVEREKAAMGVLISMQAPTKPMREEAASAGFYESPWGKHPRIQLLTVGDLLDGRTIDYPAPRLLNVTFKQAPRAQEDQGVQGELFG